LAPSRCCSWFLLMSPNHSLAAPTARHVAGAQAAVYCDEAQLAFVEVQVAFPDLAGDDGFSALVPLDQQSVLLGELLQGRGDQDHVPCRYGCHAGIVRCDSAGTGSIVNSNRVWRLACLNRPVPHPALLQRSRVR
jgi:hypothetical protein